MITILETVMKFKILELGICSHCNNTGVHLCPDVVQPVVIQCCNKDCGVTKLIETLKEVKKVAGDHDTGEREYKMTDYEYIIKQVEKVGL